MSAEAKHYYTPQEYLAFERTSPEKHEYFNGEVFRMAGASFSHATISTNIMLALGRKLRKRGCNIFANDLRTKTLSNLTLIPI